MRGFILCSPMFFPVNRLFLFNVRVATLGCSLGWRLGGSGADRHFLRTVIPRKHSLRHVGLLSPCEGNSRSANEVKFSPEKEIQSVVQDSPRAVRTSTECLLPSFRE